MPDGVPGLGLSDGPDSAAWQPQASLEVAAAPLSWSRPRVSESGPSPTEAGEPESRAAAAAPAAAGPPGRAGARVTVTVKVARAYSVVLPARA